MEHFYNLKILKILKLFKLKKILNLKHLILVKLVKLLYLLKVFLDVVVKNVCFDGLREQFIGQMGDILPGSLKITVYGHFKRTHTNIPLVVY